MPKAVFLFGSVVFLGCLSLLASSTLCAQPSGYYNEVDTSSSQALRDSLHNVIDDHQRFPYTSTATDTWDVLEIADENQDQSSDIITIYRNASYPKQGGGNDFYNREHTWPNSYGFPDDNASNYPYTDMHALFLANDSYNSSRSNLPYDTCSPGCSEKVTERNNGRGGVGGGYPGDSNWRTGSNTTGKWEVWNGRRGDVARALMYMDVRYEGGTHGLTGVSEPDLILTDNLQLIAGSNTGHNVSVAYMGILSTLLEWHDQDPVDWIEYQHHEAVASFQGNRNPFIDHPEWAECVYRDQCNATLFGITAGLNDAWYNPDTAGQGFFINVFPEAGMVFMSWFTYEVSNTDGNGGATQELGEPDHRWLTAQGPFQFQDAQAVLDVWIAEGGVFDSSNPQPTMRKDGSIELEFTGCNAGTVTYSIPSIGRQGTIPIERVATDNVAACEASGANRLAEQPTISRIEDTTEADDFRINRGLNDAWFNPATSGQGFFINVFPTRKEVFLAWFTYVTERSADPEPARLGESGHRWVTAQGGYVDGHAELDVWVTEGGEFDSAQPAPTQRRDGTISLDFNDCNAGTVTYDIPSIERTGVIPIERIVLDNVTLCESLRN